jgi:hypothetical protein
MTLARRVYGHFLRRRARRRRCPACGGALMRYRRYSQGAIVLVSACVDCDWWR